MNRGLRYLSSSLLAGALLGICAAAHASDDLPRLNPLTALDSAKPATVYLWFSQTRGITAEPATDASAMEKLRYTWALPPGFTREKPRDLVTIVHNDQQDVLWGHESYPPGSLGGDVISVAIDGTTDREDGTRLFAPRPQDVLIFRDFILEMTRTIPCRRIIHYGLGEGGMFVTTFGGRFPALSMGVIAHNSGAAELAATKGGVHGVPLVFLHGTDDEMFPLSRSFSARESYGFDGHKMAYVHVLPGWQDQPAPYAVQQAVNTCVGLSTDDPAEALVRARSLLAAGPIVGKKPIPAAPALAMAVLRRVDLEPAKAFVRDPNVPGGGRTTSSFPKPFKTVSAPVREEAIALAAMIERACSDELATLKTKMGTPELLKACADTGGDDATKLEAATAMVMHLWLLREQLRGIDAFETLAATSGIDVLLSDRADAGEALVGKLAAKPPAKEGLEMIIAMASEVAGYHSVPFDLAGDMRAMANTSGVEPALGTRARPLVDALERGRAEGVKRFAATMDGIAARLSTSLKDSSTNPR